MPSTTGPGARMYRTGDRGYWLRDGNLRLVGRRDRQIKRRGVRLGLDGVERRLESLPLIAAAAVCWNAEAQRMVALVTLHAPPSSAAWIAIDEPHRGICKVAALSETLEQELWTSVASALPAAFLPDRIFVLDRLARSSGGKINYGLLERLPWHAVRLRRDECASSAANPTEQALIEICERILGRAGVKPSERFLRARHEFPATGPGRARGGGDVQHSSEAVTALRGRVAPPMCRVDRRRGGGRHIVPQGTRLSSKKPAAAMEWPHRCGLDDVAAANVLVNADALFGRVSFSNREF